MKKSLFNTLLFLMCSSTLLLSQNEKSQPNAVLSINLAFGLQSPGGDLAERFGNNLHVGGGFGFKTRNNWIMSWDAQFVSGNTVRNEAVILQNSLTERSQILNLNGSLATVDLFQRGTYSTFNVEKILGFWQANKNSGPIIGFGAGYNISWMNIDNPGETAPQFAGDFRQGYDMLSMGFMIKQSLGYYHLARNRRINFKLSLEFGQAFTENVRGLNYYEGVLDQTQQLDLFYGLRLDWMFPIYLLRKNEQEYYY